MRKGRGHLLLLTSHLTSELYDTPTPSAVVRISHSGSRLSGSDTVYDTVPYGAGYYADSRLPERLWIAFGTVGGCTLHPQRWGENDNCTANTCREVLSIAVRSLANTHLIFHVVSKLCELSWSAESPTTAPVRIRKVSAWKVRERARAQRGTRRRTQPPRILT